MFVWTTDGAVRQLTPVVDTGVDRALPTAIGPRQVGSGYPRFGVFVSLSRGDLRRLGVLTGPSHSRLNRLCTAISLITEIPAPSGLSPA